MERKTPLYDCHLASGGKIVPFAGYLLPVSYAGTGVIAEHMAVRERAGLFDVSHMGEFLLRGEDSLENLNYILTNDFTVMADGAARYSPMCNANGGIVDDLIVYRMCENTYFIVVNAANKDKDYAHMCSVLKGNATLCDISDIVAQLALQGPCAHGLVSELAGESAVPKKRYTANFDAQIGGIPIMLSRTGYTGEDGFEIYCTPDNAPKIWELILEKGSERGVIPCGLGARDTLRLEAAMPLYGHEMDDTVSPLQTNLSVFVKTDKEDFIGKTAIVGGKFAPIKRVGLKITDKGIAREHCPVFADGRQIGETTSGTHCPYLGGAYAMALITSDNLCKNVEVSVRGKNLKAEIVPLPFYSITK